MHTPAIPPLGVAWGGHAEEPVGATVQHLHPLEEQAGSLPESFQRRSTIEDLACGAPEQAVLTTHILRQGPPAWQHHCARSRATLHVPHMCSKGQHLLCLYPCSDKCNDLCAHPLLWEPFLLIWKSCSSQHKGCLLKDGLFKSLRDLHTGTGPISTDLACLNAGESLGRQETHLILSWGLIVCMCVHTRVGGARQSTM